MGGGSPEPVSTPTGAVFLSYASQDAEAAQKICDALRTAGVEVWFDQSELRGGDAWDRQIRKQIHDCALFVPVISAHSDARREGYFRREWKLAVDRTADMAEDVPFLVPVVIDNTKDGGARVPDRFREVQWSHVPGGNAAPAFVERVRSLLSPEPPQAPAAARSSLGDAATPRLRTNTSWSSKPVLLLVVAAVAAVVIGFVALNRLVFSQRPQAQSAVLPATQSAVGTPGTVPDKSIAVLPFVDLSEKHDQEYFADGMAEEILNLLARIPELKVIGRTSSFSFKGKSNDLLTIGRALAVAYIVEGSVRRSGDNIRVTAQLIDARDGSNRWSETYDRGATDILHLQDEIAVRVAHFLNLTVSGQLPQRTTAKSAQAYDYYLRGLQQIEDEAQDSIDKARGNFQRALSIDPGFVPAAVQIAEADFLTCANGSQPAISCDQALASANAAIKLDPNNADAYAIRAETRIFYRDWRGASADVKKAADLGGGERTAFSAARLAYIACDMPKARQLLESIISRDPFDPYAQWDMGFFVELRSRHFSEAETWIRSALKVDPGFVSAHFGLGEALLMQGKLDEALDAMRHEVLNGGQLVGLAVVYYAMGRKAESDKALLAMAGDSSYMPSDFARVYAYRGELARAMNQLEKALGTHDVDLFYIKDDPLVNNLKGYAQYGAFLHKMNLPE